MAEKKEEVKEAKLVEVAVQTGLVFQTEDGKNISPEQMQLAIYNKLLKIEKAVC